MSFHKKEKEKKLVSGQTCAGRSAGLGGHRPEVPDLDFFVVLTLWDTTVFLSQVEEIRESGHLPRLQIWIHVIQILCPFICVICINLKCRFSLFF